MIPTRPSARSWLAAPALAALLALGASACGSVDFAERERDDVFALAVQSSLDGDNELAARAADHWLLSATTDDPRYDRGLRLLATTLEELGLTYAASLYFLDIAQSRRDIEVVADAIRGLERVIERGGFDIDTLLLGFVATDDISGLPPAEQAFVSYHQGLNSTQRGLTNWADRAFDAIPAGSPFYARAAWVRAIKRLAAGDRDGARVDLEEILEMPGAPDDLKLDVQRALARMAFEDKRFDDALTIFQQLRETAPDDPQLLLEMAWAHYYKGDSRRALGLLLALDAPVYRQFIAPERFLLEALSLQRLCQFEPARSAAVRLRTRHGDALADLHAGVPLATSAPLRAGAGLRTGGKPIASFRRRVEVEARKLDDLEDDLGPSLIKRLRAVYTRGVAEAARREDEQLAGEMRQLARELLSAEEGVRLILHELGIALLRGRRGQDDAALLLNDDPFAGLNDEIPVLYRFDGEFWTDELDDLVVTIEDRCID